MRVGKRTSSTEDRNRALPTDRAAGCRFNEEILLGRDQHMSPMPPSEAGSIIGDPVEGLQDRQQAFDNCPSLEFGRWGQAHLAIIT